MAQIDVVVPQFTTEQSGNSVTGQRYVHMFRELGHHSTIVTRTRAHSDLAVALNAYRTAAAVTAATAAGSQVVVVLTGTDIYRFLRSDPDVVLGTLDRAHRLVGLNDHIGSELEHRHRDRLEIIPEGARRSVLDRRTPTAEFTAVVVGHLREEKDPPTVAAAVRDLPEQSRIMVQHYGAPHSSEWAEWAHSEQQSNRRYRWHGEIPRAEMDSVYARAHVLVNSSVMEGGANAISEAVMAGLPVLASDIPGNVGVLGDDYPGYFPVGEASVLRSSLLGLERDPPLLAELSSAVAGLQPRLSIASERRRWAELLADLDVK